jgi:hypothetical protein
MLERQIPLERIGDKYYGDRRETYLEATLKVNALILPMMRNWERFWIY